MEQGKVRKTGAGNILPRIIWAAPGPESETVAPGRAPGLAQQHWSAKALAGGISKGCPCILDVGYRMVLPCMCRNGEMGDPTAWKRDR